MILYRLSIPSGAMTIQQIPPQYPRDYNLLPFVYSIKSLMSRCACEQQPATPWCIKLCWRLVHVRKQPPTMFIPLLSIVAWHHVTVSLAQLTKPRQNLMSVLRSRARWQNQRYQAIQWCSTRGGRLIVPDSHQRWQSCQVWWNCTKADWPVHYLHLHYVVIYGLSSTALINNTSVINTDTR